MTHTVSPTQMPSVDNLATDNNMTLNQQPQIFSDISQIPTPFYLIDKSKLLPNMQKMARLRELSGAKTLLALKCFASWSVFDLMRDYMDGTTSSSLNEVRLGRETFGGETHAYSVAYSDGEIDAVIAYGDKIIFNSKTQLEHFAERVHKQKPNMPIGIRLNPQMSSSSFIIADPSRPFSRLGETDVAVLQSCLPLISGVMIHNNCENASFTKFDDMLTTIEQQYGEFLKQLDWVSLGGGIHFTGEGYPLEKLAARLKVFSQTYDVQVYLEPGEASITQAATLETTVLDVINHDKALAIVDSSIEAHMLDLLIYRETAPLYAINGEVKNLTKLESVQSTQLCGKSCLAGDIFGEYDLQGQALSIGDRVSFGNAAGYTMVKKNWFNGVDMPAIVVKELDGTFKVVKQFTYQDYKASLS